MNAANPLFSNGDLADTLNTRLHRIANAVANWNEDSVSGTLCVPG
jgi:hypothetical protein